MLPSTTDLSPIGVYDSGVGGLSVWQALRARLPGESFIYVADSGNAPYGDISTALVEARARQVSSFLVQRHRVKAVVIACNTASVVAAARLRATHAIPVIAMEPAIKPAALLSKSKVILVLATSNTLRSESVARLCRMYGKDVRILLQSCPGLADQVERGEIHSDETRRLLRKYILPALSAGADTIVLGCTHYSFLSEEITLIAGSAVTVIEPSHAIARQLERVLPARAALEQSAPDQRALDTAFYTSGSPLLLSAFLASIGEPVDQVHTLPGEPCSLAQAECL
jgi:glutamate racemase